MTLGLLTTIKLLETLPLGANSSTHLANGKRGDWSRTLWQMPQQSYRFQTSMARHSAPATHAYSHLTFTISLLAQNQEILNWPKPIPPNGLYSHREKA
ncbi:hypothetical protein AXK11_04220 [Cephaloticoccus primus]|uniref:Uncharacterized protein n=1 Tax=Cephaloticoccus primus TaxID=1548207 RepID=A0A139SPV6_9BACT|nr:hypothetical protein AXK11_04220 [Cephaloticoccus primus]